MKTISLFIAASMLVLSAANASADDYCGSTSTSQEAAISCYKSAISTNNKLLQKAYGELLRTGKYTRDDLVASDNKWTGMVNSQCDTYYCIQSATWDRYIYIKGLVRK